MEFGSSLELRKIWLKYLNLPQSQEKERWLDLFLDSYLQLFDSANEEQILSSRNGWKSVGNILVNCFLQDLHHICCEVFQSSGENGKFAYSEPLKKYLLEGRGWKLLWVTECVGIEALTSTKELASVLTKLIPVVFTFPFAPSTIPDNIRKKRISVDLEDCFCKPTRNKKMCSLSKIPMDKKESKFLLKSQIAREKLRHRTERKRNLLTKRNTSSSSDDDRCGLVHGSTVPVAESNHFERTYDVVVSTIASPLFMDENESNDDDILESVTSKQNRIDFECSSLSPLEWIDFSLNFLWQVALFEHQCFYQSSSSSALISHFVSSSPLILQFAFDTLKDVYDGQYNLSNWDSEMVHKLHSQVLHIIFTSASLLINLDSVTFLPDESEIIRALLVFSADITNCNSTQDIVSSLQSCVGSGFDIRVSYNLVLGTLLLIFGIVKSSSENCSRIIHTIRNFTANGGVNICCSLISYLERNNGIEKQCPVFKILCVIKDIIVCLKEVRGQLSHHSNCVKIRHLTCKVSDFYHHHNDVLGSSLSHSILTAEPVCSVAAMCHLLLKIYSSSSSKSTMRDVVIVSRGAGICCCLDLSLLLATFFSKFHTLEYDLQHLVLSLLEKTLFVQMDLTTHNQGECILCKEKLSGSGGVTCQSASYNLNVLSSDASNEQIIVCENKISWNALSVYSHLLHSGSLHGLHLITKHIINLVTSGKESLKSMLFLKVILPEFLLMMTNRTLTLEDHVRTECFLSVFPCLLSNRTSVAHFVNSGGVPILYRVLLVPKLRKLALRTLEILILRDIIPEEEEFSYQDSIPGSSAILTVFCNTLLRYSEVLLQSFQTSYDAHVEHNVQLAVAVDESLSSMPNSGPDSSHYDIFGKCYNENFVSMSFVGDMWCSFKDLVLQSQSCSSVCEELLPAGYDLLHSVLCNLFVLSKNQQKESSPGEDLMKNAFHLVKSLITVFFFVSPSIDQNIPDKPDHLKNIKQTLEENGLYDILDLEMLLETFLCCSLQNTYMIPQHQNLQVPMYLPKDPNLDCTAPPSDISESEPDSVLDNHEADSETSNGSQWNKSYNNNMPSCTVIQHPELLKLMFELLMYFRKNFDVTEWIKVALKIMKSVTEICSSCVTNKTLLGEKDMALFLLYNFSDVLQMSDSNVNDLQKSILHLFGMIAPSSMCPRTLKKFINLLKSPSAPLVTLLNGFQSVIDSVEVSPPYSLRFPCQLTAIRNVSSKSSRFKSEINNRAQYVTSKDVCRPCAWNSTAVIFPPAAVARWNPFKKGFAFALWFMVDPEPNHRMRHLQIPRSTPAEDAEKDAHFLAELSQESDTDHKPWEAETCHVLSVGSGDVLLEMWANVQSGDIILRMNSYQKGEIKCMCEATWKGLLTPGSWHHLAMNYMTVSEKKLTDNQIQLILNGIKLHKVSLKHGQSPSQKNSPSHLLLGHSMNFLGDLKNNPSYRIGALMLFKDAVLDSETAYYLTNLGPAVANITECALQHRKLFFPCKIDKAVFSTEISLDVITGLKVPSITQLQENLLLIYNPKNPTTCFVYTHSNSTLSSLLHPFSAQTVSTRNSRTFPDDHCASQQHPSEHSLLVTGELVSECHASFCSSVHHIGGVRVFLFLLARMVEVSDEEEVQSSALDLLLKLVHSDYHFADDFLHMGGMQLLEQLLLREKCIFSYSLLKVFLNHSLNYKNLLTDDLAQKRLQRHDVVIINPSLLSLLLKSVVKSKNVNEDVFVSLFRVIQMLLHSSNPNSEFNIQQMSFVKILDTMLFLLKEKYILEDNGSLPLEVASAISPIVKKLLLKPFNTRRVCTVCDFLLLLHKASSTYVCHARKSFYFLFPEKGLGKLKRLKDQRSSYETLATLSRHSSEEWEEIEAVNYPLKSAQSVGMIGADVHDKSGKISQFPSNLSRTFSMSDSCLHKKQNVIYSKNYCHKCSCVPDALGSRESFDFIPEQEKYFPTRKLPESKEQPSSFSDEIMGFEFVQHEVRPEKEVAVNETHPAKASQKSSTVDSTDESFILIVTGLLKILQDLINDNEKRSHLLTEILQPELFIVLAHNPSDRICSEAIKVLSLYLLKLPNEKVEDFLQVKGFHLLSNQLQQFAVSPLTVEACFLAVHNGIEYNFTCTTEDSLGTEAWIPLLSLLHKSYKDTTLCNKILSAVKQVLNHSSAAVIELVNQGLCESLVHLVLNISHFTYREKDCSCVLEQKSVFDAVKCIFYAVSSETFSSEEFDIYSAYRNIVNFLSAIEMQSIQECGPYAQCVANIRDIQCKVFQSAIDFTETFITKFCKSNSKELTDTFQNSIWDVLFNMPEAVNPYSSLATEFYVTSSHEELQQPLPEARLRAKSEPTRPVVKELAISEVSERFQYLLTKSVDFVVFTDPCCMKTSEQDTFHKNLLYFMTKGLCAFLGEVGNTQKMKFKSTVWSLKDSLKCQLSRLLVATLSPVHGLQQRCYATEILANQPKCPEILSMIISSSFNNEYLPRFVHDLDSSKDYLSSKQKNDLNIVLIHLKNLQKATDTSGENVAADEFNKNWMQLWNKDRIKWVAVNNDAHKSAMLKYEKLAQQISDIAVEVTKKIVSQQNTERKKFMQKVKDNFSTEVLARTSWLAISDQMSHKRSVWYIEEAYPCSWELDPTEGPQRIRRRLRRCHLTVEPRFLLPEGEEKLSMNKKTLPLSSLFEFKLSDAVSQNVHTNEKIEYTCPCKIITSTHECEGEVLLCDLSIIFVGTEILLLGMEKSQRVVTETWPFEFIKEILPRRFELQSNAFEIFMTNGLSHLVAFKSVKDLNYFWERLKNRNLPLLTSKESLPSLIQLWRDKSITNFEYLIQLNKLAGRSFNDLMQYPVFPFILADYCSSSINLMDPNLYRNLTKPVAIQQKKREEYYINAYNCLKDEITFGPWSSSDLPMASAYHYGSHYSNSGTVLHFLIRLLPFTYSFISYQDNNFDIPDRTFHSMNTAWQLVTKESTSDVKELIPEFFFLPEFLCNKERFNFGARQNGEQVDDVTLPPWCKGNPRIFVFIHRQALESNHVTNNLNYWIDLVFGYRQTGKAAVEALNVFHPATYFGLDITKVKDPISRKALQAMIKTVGQMPQQLFFHPHPMVALSLVQAETKQLEIQPVLDGIDGLRWGDYVGSPATEIPRLLWLRKQSSPVGCLLSVLTNDVFGLPMNICLLLNHSRESNINSATYIMSAALISWGHKDGVVRIKISRDQSPIPLLQGTYADPVCLCSSVPDCRELFVAHLSGIIYVYNLSIDSKELAVVEKSPRIQLNGHFGPITCIYICKAFSIVVSSSEDKSCIIWDLNKLCYVRSICDHAAGVKLVCVSDTLGDIASVSNNGYGSCLKIHTINGELVGRVDTMHQITAVCYSTAPEGISVNVVVTGMSNGTIRLWSSWDLKPVREIKSEKYVKPIQYITFSADNQHLYAANVDGTVAVWEKPSKGLSNMPRFLMFD